MILSDNQLHHTMHVDTKLSLSVVVLLFFTIFDIFLIYPLVCQSTFHDHLGGYPNHSFGVASQVVVKTKLKDNGIRLPFRLSTVSTSSDALVLLTRYHYHPS